nr:hypothetical protein [Candidatus Protochlamydia amoebophila]
MKNQTIKTRRQRFSHTSLSFTSESVAIEHPENGRSNFSCHLDACLMIDQNAQVACVILVCRGMVFIAERSPFTQRLIIKKLLVDSDNQRNWL